MSPVVLWKLVDALSRGLLANSMDPRLYLERSTRSEAPDNQDTSGKI